MNKSHLVDAVVRQLSTEMELIATSAKTAHDEDLHKNQFDTPGLETSVLAEGQVKVAAELREAVDFFRSLPMHDFAPGEAISLGALVETEAGREHAWYFLGPKGGGIEAEFEDHPVYVITPQSPVGAKLLGKRAGDTIAGPRPLKILSVR